MHLWKWHQAGRVMMVRACRVSQTLSVVSDGGKCSTVAAAIHDPVGDVGVAVRHLSVFVGRMVAANPCCVGRLGSGGLDGLALAAHALDRGVVVGLVLGRCACQSWFDAAIV